MTTIIVNEKTLKGKLIIDLIRETGIGKIVTQDSASLKEAERTTINAIEEAREGKTIRCDNFEDYIRKAR